MKNEKGKEVFETEPENNYSILIYSSPSLTEGSCTLWSGETQLAGSSGGAGMMMPGGFGGFGGEMPEGFEGMEGMTPPEGMEIPEGFEGMTPPEGFGGGGKFERPEGMTPPDGMEFPEGMEGMTPPEGFGGGEMPEGGMRPGGFGGFGGAPAGELTREFKIAAGGNMFSGITAAE